MEPLNPITSPHPYLHRSLDDGVLTLTLADPVARCGLDVETIEALDQTVWQVATDATVRLIVLQGLAGHFGPGLNDPAFTEMHRQDPQRVRQALYSLGRWRDGQLRTLPQPVLAVIEGPCAGVFITLVQACDIALCSDDAQFILKESDAHWLAQEPALQAGADCLAARALTYHHLLGQPISGQQAERMGLVTFSHPAEQLRHELMQLLVSLREKDALALQFTKETLAHAPSMSWDAAVNFTAAKFAEIKSRQAAGTSSRAAAVSDFLAGKNKPGLGG